MQIMTATFWDTNGRQRAGEVVNGMSIVENDGKVATTRVNGPTVDEIAVLTIGDNGEWEMHAVFVGNVRFIRPVDVA